jgi:quinol monooxygenase YgiN
VILISGSSIRTLAQTIFEVYADQAAYEAHLKTPHFLKYKNGTKAMVRSLELMEVGPIALAAKSCS